MSHYLIGNDILGDVGTGGAPSVPSDVEFGPSAGETLYTDSATIFAVQEALVKKGYSVGRAGVDGKFGPDTEAALFKFSGKHGPPDDTTLVKLGVKPGQGLSKKAVTEMVAPAIPPAPKPSVLTADFWARPLWAAAPVKVWHATVGAAVGVAVATTVLALRR